DQLSAHRLVRYMALSQPAHSVPQSDDYPHNTPRDRRVGTWGMSLGPPAFPLGGAHVRYVAGANGADAAETAENGSSCAQDDLFLLSLVTREIGRAHV